MGLDIIAEVSRIGLASHRFTINKMKRLQLLSRYYYVFHRERSLCSAVPFCNLTGRVYGLYD